MANLNEVRLIGRLTRDPQSRALPTGSTVAEFGLAVNERYKDRDGNLQERPVYVEITTFGKLSETVDKYLSKGSSVLVEGRLETDAWETEQGEKRSRLKVKADRVQFLGAPRKGNDNGGGGGSIRPRRSEPSTAALEEAGL